MNDVASEPPPIAVRERGWWRVVLATLLFLFVLATPVIRIAVPPRARKAASASQAGAKALTPLCTTPQTSHSSTS